MHRNSGWSIRVEIHQNLSCQPFRSALILIVRAFIKFICLNKTMMSIPTWRTNWYEIQPKRHSGYKNNIPEIHLPKKAIMLSTGRLDNLSLTSIEPPPSLKSIVETWRVIIRTVNHSLEVKDQIDVGKIQKGVSGKAKARIWKHGSKIDKVKGQLLKCQYCNSWTKVSIQYI